MDVSNLLTPDVITCISWNREGDVVVTGSVDNTAIAWDAATGYLRQQFDFHFAPVIDVHWKDDSTFATSSGDKTIFVCQLGSPVPLRQFVGHESEVTHVRWDHSGKYLASSSDDTTAKIWTMDGDKNTCAFNLTEHTLLVHTLDWITSNGLPILVTYVPLYLSNS